MKKFAWLLMLPLVAFAASRDEYASQWPLFAASPQALHQQLQTYGQSLSENPGVYQRLWFDESLTR